MWCIQMSPGLNVGVGVCVCSQICLSVYKIAAIFFLIGKVRLFFNRDEIISCQSLR